MLKFKLPRNHGCTVGAFLAALTTGLLLTIVQETGSAQPCLHGGSLTENTFSTNCLGQLVFGKTHVGSTVGVLIRANMVDDCPGDQTLITNITDRIDFAPGVFFVTSNLVTQRILLPFLGTTSNIVKVASGPFAGSAYTFMVPPNASRVITNTGTLIARDTNSVANPNGLLGGVGSAQILVLRPGLSLKTSCPNGIGENGQIGYSGSVSNSGDAVLTNVFVFNSQPTNSTPVVGPISLSVGQAVNFSGSYPRPNPSTAAILTAFGTDELICTVSATATQTCLPILNIYTAVEIEFLTKTGVVYQIQASPNLFNWTNVGSSFPGNGNIWTNFYSTRGRAHLFYRLQQTQ